MSELLQFGNRKGSKEHGKKDGLDIITNKRDYLFTLRERLDAIQEIGCIDEIPEDIQDILEERTDEAKFMIDSLLQS